jgi:hypothetical protein
MSCRPVLRRPWWMKAEVTDVTGVWMYFLYRRRDFITLLGGAAAAWPLVVRAQQSGKMPRVGFMGNSTAALEANLVGPFRDGLRELGYEEGRNIAVEYRWAEGSYERFPIGRTARVERGRNRDCRHPRVACRQEEGTVIASGHGRSWRSG